ncbi:C-C chemokine receptor type 10 [Spea bombifrons]|uniref:C-C chemokine receptor type 10 n=1 Tax=Spea bombifrons TaxID=233779 RepID=UPI0023495B60|nr:C-C chemokine receptor type 10 [Spea bombifrons]
MVKSLLVLDVVLINCAFFQTLNYYEDFSTAANDFLPSEYYNEVSEICNKNEIQEFSRIFQLCIDTLVFLIGVSGNSLVLVTYNFSRKIKSMTDIYLINLAVADLLLLMTLPFIATNAVKGWLFGNIMCKIVEGLYSINFFSGFLFLTFISLDRYNEIVRAVEAHRMRHKSIYYSKIISVIVWVVSVLLTLPQFIYSHSQILDEVCVCSMIFPEDVTTMVKGISNFSQITLGFIVPFLVMLFCYSTIAKTLMSARSFEKNKALKVIISLVIVFVVFQLPHTLVTFLETTDLLKSVQMTCSVRKYKDIAFIITRSLAFIRCSLNPILYAFVGVKFRKDVLLLLMKVRCTSRGKWAKDCKYNRGSIAIDTSSFTMQI